MLTGLETGNYPAKLKEGDICDESAPRFQNWSAFEFCSAAPTQLGRLAAPLPHGVDCIDFSRVRAKRAIRNKSSNLFQCGEPLFRFNKIGSPRSFFVQILYTGINLNFLTY